MREALTETIQGSPSWRMAPFFNIYQRLNLIQSLVLLFLALGLKSSAN